jgi:nucleotide-binding universal stress UspA family protein
VCSKAKELGDCAVVMSSYNKGRLQELFLGSVTTHCLHHCVSGVCPLVVVPPAWRLQLQPQGAAASSPS